MQSGKILRQRYKIIDSLGSGGFGDTYLAEDLDIPVKPRSKCVVKHLSPKSSDPVVLTIAQKLFDREAATLYKLGKDSDQIPKLFAHFQEGTEFYLVQEYIEGHDISKELTPGKKLSESYTIALLKGILSALAVAHQKNIIHRDIKPENLMRRKSDNKIVLIDFGAVKEISVLTTANQPGTTTLTVAVGTPGYMPSEQSNSDPKLSSDIYAVGMVGIKALTGKDPHNLQKDSKTGNVIWRNEAQVSNHLANILDRMVHEYFPLRYENATAVLEALGLTTSPPTPQPKPAAKVSQTKTVVVNPPPPPNKTRRQILILGGLAGSGFVAAILSRGFGNKPSPQNIPTSQPILETPPEIISPPQATPVPSPLPQPKFSIQTFTTVTVNRRGEIISRRQSQAEVMTENLGNGVSLEMVKIPAGRFLMGSPETEAGRRYRESPQHYVDVPEFFMGKYPVTQAQWEV
ncbi:MAG: protein kinase, partial [Trichodesmium sp. MO_231.B1]|nr:protein kinase [Trichodesmium sp. MO_231.B1]